MGYLGIIIAKGSISLSKFVLNYALCVCSDQVRLYDDCHLFSRETVSGLLPMVQKGFGGMTMGALERFFFDIVSLMAIYFGADNAAALTVIYRVGALIQSVP